jgi:flagellar hook-length control protein FliK
MHPGGGLIATDTRLAQTAWVAEFDRRSVQRPLDKLTEKKGGDEGVWGYQALAPGARADQISMPSAPLPASSGSLVAEQVNYWIGKDVHEAELTLDGLGLDAVGVSISLQGNEAHVSFRTDQAATRQVLEGAQIHLRELLESSGLVLSGVSVGSSGAEGSPAQQRKPYANARAAVTGVTQVQPAIQGLARVGPGMGGTVDYFV